MFPNEDHLHVTDVNNNWASFADGTQLLDKLCYINLYILKTNKIVKKPSYRCCGPDFKKIRLQINPLLNVTI